MLKLNLIYEDDQILVICKPVGWVVNRAKTVKGETVQDWMRERMGWEEPNRKQIWGDESWDWEDYFKERMGIVHRLDKETSGVLVLAKTTEAFKNLVEQFKYRKVKKEYLALTHGSWKSREGVINLPLGRLRYDFRKVGVQVGGRVSQTEYRVVEEFRDWRLPDEVDEFKYQSFSLVKFKPSTGRTHQIRVHAKHVGHPVVGDLVYGGKKLAKEDRKWTGRMMLHAAKLSLRHPVIGEELEFSCRAEDFEMVMREVFLLPKVM